MRRWFVNSMPALALTLMMCVCSAGISHGAIADFENFTEGGLGGGPVTDPQSGITFSNPISANSNFVIEFSSSSPSRPLTSPGNVLGTNGYAPGPGFSLGHQFGFTGTLPAPTGLLEMEMAYTVGTGASGQVTLIGFNSANVQVASTLFTSNAALFVETTLSLSSLGNDISSFQISSTDIFNAFDNIRFTPVPEPSAFAGAAIGAIGLVRRGRRPMASCSATDGVCDGA